MSINFIFLLLALFAEVVGTIGGFGSSVFFVPLGNIYFGIHTVLGLTATFHLSSNVSKILLFRDGIDRKLLWNLGIPAVLFVVLGGLLSKQIGGDYLELILGVFLLTLSAFFLIKKDWFIAPNRRNSILGGILSGFSAGLFGTGGAIRGLTMASFNLEKSIFIATSAMIDLMIDFSRTVVYFFNGYITKDVLWYVPFLLVVGFLGSYIGKQILNFIPEKTFRLFSLSLIFLIGIFTIYQAVAV